MVSEDAELEAEGVEHDDEPGDEPGDDEKQEKVAGLLSALFRENRERVFYSRQLEIRHEGGYFHWITNRALHQLEAAGEIVIDPRRLVHGSSVKLAWNRRHRYPLREAARAVELINSYSTYEVAQALGDRGEQLVHEAFALNGFRTLGRNVREHQGVTWTESNHNLDFAFERDGRVYGVEVKNTLRYPPQDEVETKTAMAVHLGMVPLFVVRAMPRTWFHQVNQAGGFVLVLGWQLYPKLLQSLVDDLRATFGLPVDTPRALYESTMQRVLTWHDEQLAAGDSLR